MEKSREWIKGVIVVDEESKVVVINREKWFSIMMGVMERVRFEYNRGNISRAEENWKLLCGMENILNAGDREEKEYESVYDEIGDYIGWEYLIGRVSEGVEDRLKVVLIN